MRSFITVDAFLKRLARWLPLWFLLPAVSSCAWYVLSRVFAVKPGDPFEFRGDHWIWIKACFNGLVGLLVGLAINRRGLVRVASSLAAVLLIALDHTRVGEGWSTTLVDRSIENVGYHLALAHPFVPQDVAFQGGLQPPLAPRTQLDVVTPIGPLRIRTGNGTLRTYTWDGVTRSLQLFPPGGPQGAGGDSYQPSKVMFHTRREVDFNRLPAHDWVAHKGISRGEEWESVIDFESIEQAQAWLRQQQNETMPYVWTHDGLVVGWSTGVDYKALTVEVWQILIRGQKPNRLAGSHDDKIRISST